MILAGRLAETALWCCAPSASRLGFNYTAAGVPSLLLVSEFV